MQANPSWARRATGSGFLAGAGAGACASAAMLMLNAWAGGLSLPQELGDRLLGLMPGPAFEFFHMLLGADAKYYFFGLVLVGQVVVFALGGLLWNQLTNRANAPASWLSGLQLGGLLWLFAGLIVLPLTGSGLFGASLSVGLDASMISLAVVGLIFGLLWVPAQRWIAATPERGERIPLAEQSSRRVLLKGGLLVAGAAVVGVVAWKFISGGFSSSRVPVSQLLQGYRNKISPPPVPNYGTIVAQKDLTPEVTSNDQFYIVSKNLTDPTVSYEGWSLSIEGLVDRPYKLSYDELTALPTQQQYETLECISNTLAGSYMSNAQWEGVRLADILQKAGVKQGATKVVLHASDDYADSIHLSKALEATTVVALRMNGTTLPAGHGFPARLLVPGIYGMKHVKWLTRIEVVNYDFQGYWQKQGWSDPAPVRMTSRIDTPLDGNTVSANRPTYLAGVAFSGNLGISQVDVSVDAGKTWQRATLKQPLSQLSWVLWELPWTPAAGAHTIVVRAIDLQGNVQDPRPSMTLPDGASGYHSIGVTAS